MNQQTRLITLITIGITLISIVSIYFVSSYGLLPFQKINFESQIISHKYGGERSEYVQFNVRPDLNIDRERLEKSFQISPAASFDVASKGSTISMIFNQALLANTKYTVSLANDLFPRFTYSFTTPPLQILTVSKLQKKDSAIVIQDFNGKPKTLLQKPYLQKVLMTNDKVVYAFKNSDDLSAPTLVGYLNVKDGTTYDFPQEYSILIEIFVDEVSNQLIVQDAAKPQEILDLNSHTTSQLFDDPNSNITYLIQEYIDKNTLVLNSNFGNTYIYDIPSKTQTFIGKFNSILNYSSLDNQLCFLKGDQSNSVSKYTIGGDAEEISVNDEDGMILGANNECKDFFVQAGTYEKPERLLIKNGEKTSLDITSKKDSFSAYSILSDRGYLGIAQSEYNTLTEEYESAIYIYDSNNLENKTILSNTNNLIMY